MGLHYRGNSQNHTTSVGIPRSNKQHMELKETLQYRVNSQKQNTIVGISIKLLFRVNSQKHYTTEGNSQKKYTSEGTLYYRSRESKEQSTTEGIQRNTTLQRELQETLHYIKANSKGISGKGNFKTGINMFRSRF